MLYHLKRIAIGTLILGLPISVMSLDCWLMALAMLIATAWVIGGLVVDRAEARALRPRKQPFKGKK